MAKYKTKSQSFINDTLVPADVEVDFDGEPGENLEPVDDAAKEAVATAAARREAKAAAIKSALQGTIDPANAETIQNLITQVQDFAGRLAAAEARVAQVEGATKPDLTPYAQRTDVTELDAGMNILAARVSEVEGTLNALARKTEATAAAVAEAAAQPTEPAPTETPSA